MELFDQKASYNFTLVFACFDAVSGSVDEGDWCGFQCYVHNNPGCLARLFVKRKPNTGAIEHINKILAEYAKELGNARLLTQPEFREIY